MKYIEQPAFETNEFKIGDKINIYESSPEGSATLLKERTVDFVGKNRIVGVQEESRNFHFKQCRLLLPAKPREFTLFKDKKHNKYYSLEGRQSPQCRWDEVIRVKEVLEDE